MSGDRVFPVIIAFYLLLPFTSVCECELGRKVREYEVGVFKHLNTRGDVISTRPGCVTWHANPWIYEVCPGRWIRQYRQKMDVIVEEIVLGVQDRWHITDEVGSQLLRYESGSHTLPDRLKAAGTPIEAASAPYTCPKDRKSQYRKQVDVLYDNGSFCEQGIRHSAFLHLLCDENMLTPSVKFAEPFSCNSDIMVISVAVCDAMHGRIPSYSGISDIALKFSL